MSRTRHELARGVSLVEALVAMAVMAFGMLGVAGLQASLRTNADAAKQRSEATRIAQERLEQWRRFSVLDTTAGHANTYAAIASAPTTTVAGYTTNTSYNVSGEVTESSPPGQKTLVVDVGWTDRIGQAQSVRLFSVVARISPVLSASLAIPAGGTPARNPLGRHRGIPVEARDFGDGTSGFKPPQSSGGTVAWLFNNAGGWFRICTTTVASTAALTSPSDLACVVETDGGVEVRYLLLGGFVRYDTTTTAPNASTISNPTGPLFPAFGLDVRQTAPSSRTADCFISSLLTNYREYFCAMRITVASPTWSGTVDFDSPLDVVSSAGSGDPSKYRVCRYRPTGPYTGVVGSLPIENYAIIKAGSAFGTPFACPAPVTWAHQPA